MPEVAQPSQPSGLLEEARNFHQSFASLLMATAGPAGDPVVASYAPYVTGNKSCF